jgi:hypothetical protein
VVNWELVRAVERRDQRRLATCAHEIGHALAAQTYGLATIKVRLKFGMFGGLTGGQCVWEDDFSDASLALRTAYLIALMGGHAAEVRFCQLYLGMNERKAYRYGRDWAEGDYQHFDAFRKAWRRYGARISRDDAFERAGHAVARHSDRIDQLTLRLDKTKYLSGRQL